MSAFEIVLIVVAVVALALAATGYFRNALSKLGEDPAGFAHPDDRPISDQPSEDERDEPLPKRPPRGRGF